MSVDLAKNTAAFGAAAQVTTPPRRERSGLRSTEPPTAPSIASSVSELAFPVGIHSQSPLANRNSLRN